MAIDSKVLIPLCQGNAGVVLPFSLSVIKSDGPRLILILILLLFLSAFGISVRVEELHCLPNAVIKTPQWVKHSVDSMASWA
jgi:hypothetical protein